MSKYLSEVVSFFKDLLLTDNLIIESLEFTNNADEYDVDKYLTKKTLYYNKNTGVLTALCPLPSVSLKKHKEITKMKSNINFRWIVKSRIKNERFYDGGTYITIQDQEKIFNTMRFF